MNKKGKVLAGILCFILMIAMTACGSGSSSSSGTAKSKSGGKSSGGSSSKPVQVNFVRWSNGPALDKQEKDKVKRFNASHPKVHVNMTILPYDQTFKKIELSLASNNPVDMFYWDDQAYSWYKKGLVKNLQPYFNKDINMKDYSKKLFAPFKFDGKNMYVAPENYQTIVMYYNKSLFDKAGLSYPNASWTWQDVLKTVKKLTIKKNGKTVQYGLDTGDLGNWWGWSDLILEQGGKYVNSIHNPTKVMFDTPQAKKTMKFLTDLQYKYKVMPTSTEKNALGGGFFSGKIGIYIGGDWNLATAKTVKSFKWNIAPLPSWQGKRVVPYFVGGYAITTKSKHPKAAWEFIKWAMTTNQKTLAKQGSWIPVYKPVLNNLTPPSWAPSGYKSARLDWMKYGRIGSVYSDQWSQILDKAINPNTQQIFTNHISVDKGMKQMNKQANQILKGK